MLFNSILLSAIVGIQAAIAAPTLSPRQAVPPRSDPFYKPPANFEKTAPGTILRNRTIAAGFLGLVPEAVEAWQLLYRTTAIDGSAIATVTTIFKPLNAKLDRFVSFQTAYDSSDTICDPSYVYRLGDPPTDLITSFENLLLQAYLGSGYIIASPDYEGPDAAFSPGHLAGMGVLDGMKAVNNFGKVLQFSTSTPMIVGSGYSGGGIATGWAASLQQTYAPDLNVKGWASGGTPANLTGTLVYLDGSLFSGFLPDAFAGQLKPSAYQAQLQPIYEKYATEYGKSKVEFTTQHCAVADIGNFAQQSILSPQFTKLGSALLSNPTVHAIFQQNIMGLYKNETPIAPVYMYHATLDEIIPYANASTLATSWCNDGATVEFSTFASGGHATTEIIALPSVLSYISSAFAGTVAKQCSRNTNTASTLLPIALGTDLEPIAVALIEALGIAGFEDANLKSDPLGTLRKTVS